jgi:hypothetical protein
MESEVIMRLVKQIEYCKKNNLPMFAPEDGICWSCHRQISDSGTKHITGCERCHRTYCG